ncbi:MAG: sugar phosphate isomerase/epimerase [Burkholderia gladioli]|uniref:Sugar phosphate isomerase/epimerase n=1 Tax=Paraburkholderia tropica TaxID=92647 RepID=A0ABX5MM18_9BURK|nr:sugar phosphate isomerase/epimerase [Paraburkholderia tropica]PXX12567.1 sugar phosphate isomerase/epimerase [Paraburkholderia tropica]PZW76544.1 sugar phosphate isomerase/epimerase [Paraburkholderia tropica]
MTRRRYFLAHLTLQRVEPPKLVAIASAAGFDGVSLVLVRDDPASTSPCYSMLGGGCDLMRETQAILDATGIEVVEVGGFRLNSTTSIPSFAPMLEAGQRLRARYAMTVCDHNDTSLAVEQLSAFASLAALYGITPILEFIPYSGIKTLQEANAVVEACEPGNVQIMVDALHWTRSGGNRDDVYRTPAGRMPYIQLCDAPAVASTDIDSLKREARTQRMFPGAGDLDLPGLLSAFPPDTAVSIEVPMLKAPFSDAYIARIGLLTARKLCEGV